MLCKDSKATKILSDMRRLLVKALWCSVIIFGNILLSLFAKTLEKILYNTLHKLIGLNSEACSGFFFFGIRVMNVWLRCSGREAEFKNLGQIVKHPHQ